MELNEFKKYMLYLQKSINKNKQFIKSIKNYFGAVADLTADAYQLQDYYIKLLEHIFADNDGWIFYFVYECNFGANNLKVIVNNELYKLDTVESLYNLLIMNKVNNE